MGKFNNIRTKYKGKTYDSKSEAEYARILDELLDAGKIKEVKRQVKYPLMDMNGTKRLRYVADFVVTKNDGSDVVIDVKGVLTPANKVKLGYVRYVYGVKVELVYTTGLEKFRTQFLLA